MLDKRQIIGIAAAFTVAMGLAACGSSDDDDNGNGGTPAPPPPPASEVPASASTLAGFIAFLQSLASNETSEPIALGTFVPPTDDTGEPQPL